MPLNFTGHDDSMANPILLMTRPLDAANRFVQGLSTQTQDQVSVIYTPLMEIVPLGVEIDLVGIKGVIFTSANGVAHAGPGKGMSAYCVGAQTAHAAQVAGWVATFVGENAESLISELKRNQPETPLLHVVGVHQRGDIAHRLTKAGLQTASCVVYDQRLCCLTDQAKAAIFGEALVFVPLFSPRTATQFACEVSATLGQMTPHLHVIALSAAVTEALSVDCAWNMHILSNSTAQDMHQELEKLVSRVTLP